MLSEPVNSEKSDPPYCTLYNVHFTMYTVHLYICNCICEMYFLNYDLDRKSHVQIIIFEIPCHALLQQYQHPCIYMKYT